VRAASFATAAAMSRNRRVWSTPFAADQADVSAVLVGEHPVTVDLLLEHPAVAVERLAGERGGHWGVLRDVNASFGSQTPAR